MTIPAAVGLLAALAAAAGAEDRHQSFDINIPQAPAPVISDGHVAMVYELHLTNFAAEALKLVELRVLPEQKGSKIATFRGRDLVARTVVAGSLPHARTESGTSREQSDDGFVVRPGERAIVFIELDLPLDVKPRSLRHELDYGLPDGAMDTVVLDAVVVNTVKPTVLGPPLRGGPWVAVHDPSWARGHRRVTYAMGGKARLPGRFALDWVGTDAAGHVSRGDPDRPADAIGYNAEVLAGADAVVWAIRDHVTESASIKNSPAHPLGEGAGNYVALRLGPNRFAFYEHLRPESIRVKVGDRVKKGQVIGSLGFTGDTTGPHLHLHVADCDQTLQCEGVPFTVEHMELLGRYDNIADLGQRPWNPDSARQTASPEWPAYNVVVRFP